MKGHVIGMSHNDSHPLLWMIEGRSVSAKSDRMTWRSEWVPRLEKFSENALKASSSRNRTLEGEGSVEEEAPERRGFQARVDLRLDAIDMTNVNKFRGKRREEQSEKSQAIQIYQIYEKRVRMHGKCMNMWHANKKKSSWAQPNSILPTHKHITHI